MDELNIYNLILRDRERRIEFIKTFVKKYNVICVKTNVIGTYKRSPKFDFFKNSIDNACSTSKKEKITCD